MGVLWFKTSWEWSSKQPLPPTLFREKGWDYGRNYGLRKKFTSNKISKTSNNSNNTNNKYMKEGDNISKMLMEVRPTRCYHGQWRLPETKEKKVVVTADSAEPETMIDKPSEMECSTHTASTALTTPRPIPATPPALFTTLLPWKKEQNGCGSVSCPFFFHPEPRLLWRCVWYRIINLDAHTWLQGPLPSRQLWENGLCPGQNQDRVTLNKSVQALLTVHPQLLPSAVMGCGESAVALCW